MKKEEEMIDEEADIVRLSALARERAEAEANESSAKEVSSEIRASMEAK